MNMELTIDHKNVYVVSDIHNDAKRFKKLLELIQFSKEDHLIIAGDIFDRGDNPVDLYFEILKYENIICLQGNHDDWVRAEIYDKLVRKDQTEYISYGTFELLRQRLTEVDMITLADWIGRMPYYLSLVLNERYFQISHAQTYPTPERIWDKYKFLLGDMHYEDFLKGYYHQDGMTSVVGHTPTDDKKIWKSSDGKLIRIDCGNGFQEIGWGQLAAIRLNDMEEFYVE